MIWSSPSDGLEHSLIEGAGLFEHGDEIAEVILAGSGVEVAVLAHERLQGVEEVQAPSGIDGPGHPLAGHIDIHGRGVGQG